MTGMTCRRELEHDNDGNQVLRARSEGPNCCLGEVHYYMA